MNISLKRRSNGCEEKFFRIFEKKVKFFPSIKEFMIWYNEVRPHDAFDLTRAQTPMEMFYKRMADAEFLIGPEGLTLEVERFGKKH